MAFINCRTFLKCLPLRAGVWVVALALLMLAGAAGTGSWMEVEKIQDHPVPLQDEIALFAQATVFTLLAVFSFVGFIGGVSNSRTVVYVYSKLLIVQFILSLLSFGDTLYYTFRPATAGEIFDCTSGDTDEFIVQFCNKGLSLVKLLPLIVYLVSLLVLIYSFILAINFAEELELDEAASYDFGPSDSYMETDPYFVAKREKMNRQYV